MKLIVANWKMNLNPEQASEYLAQLKGELVLDEKVEVVLAPTFLALDRMSKERGEFSLAAQNCATLDSGALTGEVSAEQMVGLVDYVIVGHSERRMLFDESDAVVRAKIEEVLHNGLKPILCVGERNLGEIEEVLRRQITVALTDLNCKEMIIAYEPVYAVGAAESASSDQISRAVNLIHEIASEIAEDLKVKILYGGSVDETNTEEILNIQGIEGLLVGRASLNATKFAKIVNIARV